MSEPAIDAALFEGMFVRAFHPDGELVAELRTIGFDLARIQGRYPVSVWRKALDITRRRLFPDRSEERGLRALGNLFIEGYFDTIIGRVISVPMKFMPPERVIQRMPKNWAAARPDVKITQPVKEAPTRWRVHFHDEQPLPGFFAGVVEGASRRTSRKEGINVTVERVNGPEFDLVMWW
jgi:uncharacterized protein (TIGR02265 family)